MDRHLNSRFTVVQQTSKESHSRCGIKPMDLGEISDGGFVSALESIPEDMRARLTDRGLYANAQSGTATTDDEVRRAIGAGERHPRGVQVTHIRKRRIILLNSGARPTPQSFADDHCMDAACIELVNILSHRHNTTEVVCEVPGLHWGLESNWFSFGLFLRSLSEAMLSIEDLPGNAHLKNMNWVFVSDNPMDQFEGHKEELQHGTFSAARLDDKSSLTMLPVSCLPFRRFKNSQKLKSH